MGSALQGAIAAATGDRGFILHAGLVEVRITWLSLDPRDRSQPDLDNMLKPLVDALNLAVIEDDRQVHSIVAKKGSINAPPAPLAAVFQDVQDDPLFGLVREVVIIELDAV